MVEKKLNTIRDTLCADLMSTVPPLERRGNLCRNLSRFLEQSQNFSRALIQEAGIHGEDPTSVSAPDGTC